ncbi:hypothetical protein Csa_002672, partial [Cucumis sativus]
CFVASCRVSDSRWSQSHSLAAETFFTASLSLSATTAVATTSPTTPPPPPITPPPPSPSPPPFSPPPPPPPHRHRRNPPPPLASSVERKKKRPPVPPKNINTNQGSKRSLNKGKKVGLFFVGIAAVLQICVVGFLVFKRRQLLRVKDRYEGFS